MMSTQMLIADASSNVYKTMLLPQTSTTKKRSKEEDETQAWVAVFRLLDETHPDETQCSKFWSILRAPQPSPFWSTHRMGEEMLLV